MVVINFIFSDIVQRILAVFEDVGYVIQERRQWYLPVSFVAYVTRLCGFQVLKNYVDYV